MTFNNPATLAQLADAIARRGTFTNQGVSGHYIAVLSYGHGFPHLAGPLADDVHRSAKDLCDRYMHRTPPIALYASGGEIPASVNARALYADEVVYYVTGARGYVLGYLRADGRAEIAPAVEVTPRRYAAIMDGLTRAAETLTRRANGSDGGEMVIDRATGQRVDSSPLEGTGA